MGKPFSEGVRYRHIRELAAFRLYWQDSPEYPEENRGNDYIHFPVSVRYQWGDGKSIVTFTSSMRVSIHPGDDGNVEISPTAKIKTSDFHLGLGPGFQRYRYDEAEHTLIIEGNSDKMAGAYSVTILPTIAPP